MAALTNLSFEAGSAGVATAWTNTAQSSVEDLDQFAGGGVVDGFEIGWGITVLEVEIIDSINGTARTWTNPLGPTIISGEGFEVGWDSNEHYETELVGEEFGFVTGFFVGPEGFEGWSTWQTDFGSSVSNPIDDFETGWGNDTYETVILPGGNGDDWVFSGLRSQAAEDFEHKQADQSVIPSTVDGSFTYTAHPFSAGYTAQVYNKTGLLPGGWVDSTPYTLVVVDANTLKLAVYLTASIVIPSTSGSGITYLSEPYEFWSLVLPF